MTKVFDFICSEFLRITLPVISLFYWSYDTCRVCRAHH